MNPADTIVAISSAAGAGARLIVRLSGAQALELAQRVGARIDSPGAAQHRHIHFAGLAVPAWVYVFHAPRSYTGENLVEFHLPGNPLLARRLLNTLLADGARPAEAGEFTARAFFNGRIDLTEAEGVAATISANNEQELQAARQLMAGELARRLHPAMDLLAETLALTEVGIDFADEDVTFLSMDETRRRLHEMGTLLKQVVDDSTKLERLSHEPQIVLVGKTNVGKSTLLNALSGQERAVVSPVAGTTRDVLSAEVALERGIVRLIDAAGLDDVPDDASVEHEIARQMQSRARRAVEEADRVVLVQDADEPVALPGLERSPDLIVLSKADLRSVSVADESIIEVSAQTGQGMSELRRRLDQLAFGVSAQQAKLALNSRHLQALSDARVSIELALQNASAGAELLAADLREALEFLGSIVGSVSPDELLNQIFSRFCIGK